MSLSEDPPVRGMCQNKGAVVVISPAAGEISARLNLERIIASRGDDAACCC